MSTYKTSHPCPVPGCSYDGFYAVLLDVHLAAHHPWRDDGEPSPSAITSDEPSSRPADANGQEP